LFNKNIYFQNKNQSYDFLSKSNLQEGIAHAKVCSYSQPRRFAKKRILMISATMSAAIATERRAKKLDF